MAEHSRNESDRGDDGQRRDARRSSSQGPRSGQRSGAGQGGSRQGRDRRDGDRGGYGRTDRGDRPRYEDRGARRDGENRNQRGGERSYGNDRGPRRDGDNRGYRGGERSYGNDRGPRRDGDNRGYRGGERSHGNDRGPRRDGDNRGYRGGERSYGNDRGPRRDGENRSYRGGDRSFGNDRGQRRDGEHRSYRDDRGPRREGDQRSTRPGQEARAQRPYEPEIPEGITGAELDQDVRLELRGLSKETAERVSQHLVAAFALEEAAPELSQAHARFAGRIGGRVGVVREMNGILAYRAGDYRTAVRELRTSMRITGRTDVLPMIADAERGLGRPERALDIAASEDATALGVEGSIELMIVVAGAYADTGDVETALRTLDVPALRHKVDGRWQVRLWAAYADLLELAGRGDEAKRWLTLAADADTEGLTDAAARLGRPAPAPTPEPSWEDDEQISVLDAFEDTEDVEDDEQDATTAGTDELESPEDDEPEDEDGAADGRVADDLEDADDVDEPAAETPVDAEPESPATPEDQEPEPVEEPQR